MNQIHTSVQPFSDISSLIDNNNYKQTNKQNSNQNKKGQIL